MRGKGLSPSCRARCRRTEVEAEFLEVLVVRTRPGYV